MEGDRALVNFPLLLVAQVSMSAYTQDTYVNGLTCRMFPCAADILENFNLLMDDDTTRGMPHLPLVPSKSQSENHIGLAHAE